MTKKEEYMFEQLSRFAPHSKQLIMTKKESYITNQQLSEYTFEQLSEKLKLYTEMFDQINSARRKAKRTGQFVLSDDLRITAQYISNTLKNINIFLIKVK